MESEGSHKVLGYSTYSSSLPIYHQHQPQPQQQYACTESLYLDVHQSTGQAAAIHDFLSLCGIGNATSIVTEMSATTGDSSLRLEGKTHDSKGIALRSKHSATEQRRRSKINERFQTLKQLLPNVDQKKDKASVLLEAIEYIQILQEKLKCFEASEQERQEEQTRSRQLDGNVGLEGPTEKSSNASSLSIAALERKGLPEANGHMRSRSGSLSTVCENGTLGPNFGANRLTEGSQACQSNHNGNLAVSQPVSPAFLTHSVIESTSASTVHSTRRTPLQASGKPSHLLSNEEQATLAAYSTPKQAEILGFSQSLEPQGSNTKLDWDNEKVRTSPCTLESVGNRDHSKDVEYTKRTCNPDLQQRGGAHVQDSEIYNDRGADAQKEKQVKEMTTAALETHSCHGDPISPSKFYSQRLQERIRLALHNSGIDLNHTQISVQLQLEETCKAIFSESGMIDALNSGQPQELDHIRKRSKTDTSING